MEKSFEMLSSMSPKIKGRQKTVKKAITLLATKKHFRRSSMYENLPPTIKNKNLHIIDGSTDSNSVVSSSDKENDKVNKLINQIQEVIVIDSSSEEESLLEKSFNKPSQKKNGNGLQQTGGNSLEESLDSKICHWLKTAEPVSQNDNLTMFSQVSTIFGESDNLLTNGDVATHSTFCEKATRRFDEFFKNESKFPSKYENLPKKIDEVPATDSEESFVIQTSLTDRLCNSKNKKKTNKENSIEIPPTPEDSYVFNLEDSISKKSDKTTEKSAKLEDKISSKSRYSPSEGSFKFNLEGSSLESQDKTKEKRTERSNTPTQKLSVEKKDKKKAFTNSRDSSSDISYKFNIEESLDSKEKTKHNFNSEQDMFQTPKLRLRIEKTDNLGLSIDDMDSIMSTLYGEEWSAKKDIILTPKTEPKKKTKYQDLHVAVPTTTERKKIPPLKENLLNNIPSKKLNLKKLHQPVNSPWMDRLKNICDSDTDSEKSDKNSNKITSRRKCNQGQIDFSDCDDDKSDLENSYWGESLEDRIKKKMNNVKMPPEKNINKKQTKKVPTKKVTSKTQKRNSTSSESNDVNEDSDVSSDREFDLEITRICATKRKSKKKEGGYTFLESLSGATPLSKIDIITKIYRTNFAQHRDSLARKLFNLFNEKVFDSAIPTDSELTWNERLRGTAGLCHCKKITHRDGKVERKVRIDLSSKVLTSADRLRDTLVHEMCHAATWIVNQVSDGHGSFWKAWAIKAMKTFPELPPIKRCHSYVINTKYTYRCTQCGYSFGRHKKSLDLSRKCCGICRGKFEVLINKISKQGETKSVPASAKKEPTGFALFVKENYANYKQPTKTHGDVMKMLGQKFAEMKVKK